MSQHKIAYLFAVMVVSPSLFGQFTIKNGEVYVDYVHITFSREVVVPNDSSGICSIDDIKPEFSALRSYLRRVGPVILKQTFPGTRWGDTLRVNSAGAVVRVQNLARNFTIYFPKPMLERKVLRALRRFPEVRKVTAPVVTQPDTHTGAR